jgi:hypothetical protein
LKEQLLHLISRIFNDLSIDEKLHIEMRLKSAGLLMNGSDDYEEDELENKSLVLTIDCKSGEVKKINYVSFRNEACLLTYRESKRALIWSNKIEIDCLVLDSILKNDYGFYSDFGSVSLLKLSLLNFQKFEEAIQSYHKNLLPFLNAREVEIECPYLFPDRRLLTEKIFVYEDSCFSKITAFLNYTRTTSLYLIIHNSMLQSWTNYQGTRLSHIPKFYELVSKIQNVTIKCHLFEIAKEILQGLDSYQFSNSITVKLRFSRYDEQKKLEDDAKKFQAQYNSQHLKFKYTCLPLRHLFRHI